MGHSWIKNDRAATLSIDGAACPAKKIVVRLQQKFFFLIYLFSGLWLDSCVGNPRYTTSDVQGGRVFEKRIRCSGNKYQIIDFTHSSTSYNKTGKASFYGEKFHGRKTASGEIYDRAKFTAAHRTFSFGTLVKVTNTKNGKSVIVRVNDRGPHKPGRIIDLSYAAAIQLDMVRFGLVSVVIERIEK